MGQPEAPSPGLHDRFREFGIDDKFMRQIAGEVEKGRSALFVLYEGLWQGSRAAVDEAITSAHVLLIYSALSPENAANMRAVVEVAAEELGGEEVVDDYEVETEPEEEATEAAPAAPQPEPANLTTLSGSGPKGSEVLVAAGIDSYSRLAHTSEP